MQFGKMKTAAALMSALLLCGSAVSPAWAEAIEPGTEAAEPGMEAAEAATEAGTESSVPAVRKLGGWYVSFEGDSGQRTMALKQGILTITDGMISEITEYAEDDPEVVYLDPSCVMLPGLLELHTHIDYNGIQLWESEETTNKWDNRFEWRGSASYRDDIRTGAGVLEEEWQEPAWEGAEGVTKGDLIQYFAELQAAAGGATMFQGINDTQDTYDSADSHAKIGVIRSTALASDLGREEGEEAQSIIQLYVPGPEDKPTSEDPSTYLPPMDTSSWRVAHATDYVTGEDWPEEVLTQIENGSRCGYLVHMAEGRAGNFLEAPDAFAHAEFDTFMEEIDAAVEAGRFTAEDVRNAHICLIHACTVDLADERVHEFLTKYGIGLIWSPVSNLMMYGDTPAFYRYLEDPELLVAIGSDWSPSGSKTVWDECRFAYDLIRKVGEETDRTKEEILKSCTVDAAETFGDERFGNLAEGAFADIFILRTGDDIAGSKEAVLEAFLTEDDRAAEAVITGGRAVYGEKAFLEAYTPENFAAAYGHLEDDAREDKYYYLPESMREKSLQELYTLYADQLTAQGLTLSELRGTQDRLYQRALEEILAGAGETEEAVETETEAVQE